MHPAAESFGPPAVDRVQLPRMTERIGLGKTPLEVSPFCVGSVGRPEVVAAAFRAGINFFFLSADMHWPLYEATREGLRQLFRLSPRVREQVVVAVVSYVSQPEFCWAPFEEVLEAVPGLGHADVAVIGGSYPADFLIRHQRYRATRPGAMKALGATFHDRATAITAVNHDLLDVAFIRYNSAHDGAEADVFPHIRQDRSAKLFNFQSMHGYVDPMRLASLNLPDGSWRPHPTDHYRFALRVSKLDGVLCSFGQESHVAELVEALTKPPLSKQEVAYLKGLSDLNVGKARLIGAAAPIEK